MRYRVDDAAQALNDEDGRGLVADRILLDGLNTDGHEVECLLFRA